MRWKEPRFARLSDFSRGFRWPFCGSRIPDTPSALFETRTLRPIKSSRLGEQSFGRKDVLPVRLFCLLFSHSLVGLFAFQTRRFAQACHNRAWQSMGSEVAGCSDHPQTQFFASGIPKTYRKHDDTDLIVKELVCISSAYGTVKH